MNNIEIRIKRGTSIYLAELNPVLDPGEPCLETDTNKVKYGDGTTPYNLLAYATGADSNSGTNNTVTGTDGFIGGGNTNTVSGTSGFIGGGSNNTASGINSSVLAGSNNTASGINSSVLGGLNNTASGTGSAVVGYNNIAEGDYSLALGKNSKATKTAQIAISSGGFNNPGDAQFSIFQMRTKTEGEVTSYLSINGLDFPNGSYLSIPIGTAWGFDIKITAYDTSADLTAQWNTRGGVRRNFSGVTSLIGQPIIESSAEESWEENADINVYANSTDADLPNTLVVSATGVAGRVVYWNAVVMTVGLSPKPPLTSDFFVEVSSTETITSLDVGISNGGELMPAFDPTIQDYCIYSGTDNTDNYSITINGNTTTGTIDVNKALHVTYGSQQYFIRVIPTDLPMVEVQEKNNGYVPGYYLYNPVEGNGANYFIVFNENGTPIWYAHDDRYNGFSLHCTVPNKLVLHTWASSTRYVVELGLNQTTATKYTMKNEETNSHPIWECHESHMIAGPEERRGNFISMTYAYGCSGTYMPNNELYIQELSADGQTIVWDWHSDDYFDIGGYSDYFHANSIDVHPITGDLLISCRHPGGGFCIDYSTKEVKWVMQGTPCCADTGTFYNVRRPEATANTHWLTITGDPHSGPSGNHDARWHHDIAPITPGNEIITLYDDHSNNDGPARGVTYEIDIANNHAIFRAHAYSINGSSPYQGGFTLVKELNGSYSHAPDFIYENPALVEFNNGTNLNPNQNRVFSVSIPGNYAYRIVKVRPDFLDIDFMRTTAGRSLILP